MAAQMPNQTIIQRPVVGAEQTRGRPHRRRRDIGFWGGNCGKRRTATGSGAQSELTSIGCSIFGNVRQVENPVFARNLKPPGRR